MNRQTGDLMKSTITRAILLVAPVIDALQEQLAADFPLLRLYEQEDPIAFLREQERILQPWSPEGISGYRTASLNCCRTWV
jgi:hypothetical protein